MLRTLGRCWHGAYAWLALALPVLVLLILYQVIGRTFDLGDVSWIEDICRLILLWVGLLFVPALQWKDEHIAVRLFRPANPQVQRLQGTLRQAAFLLAGGFFLYFGAVNVVREAGMYGAGGMELPLEFFNVVMPICGLLICAVVVGKSIVAVRRRD